MHSHRACETNGTGYFDVELKGKKASSESPTGEAVVGEWEEISKEIAIMQA